MVAKISVGSSLFGALSYNQNKVDEEQGDMDNRLFRFQVCGQVHIETFHTPPDAEIPVLALEHPCR